MKRKGIAEKPLLSWFGASAERIAILAVGLPGGRAIPTHVAREITIHHFRADFAWLFLPTSHDEAPHLMFIELQGALHTSIFKLKGKRTPEWSMDFLSGFGQLVDWNCFSGEIAEWSALTKLVVSHTREVRVDYALVAGLSEDIRDKLSERRLNHWREKVRLGNNLHLSTFDELPNHAKGWCELVKAALSIH
ncbi:MAG: Shedu anti-phage system protein SduA domain-containing protein [Massilia sp.]